MTTGTLGALARRVRVPRSVRVERNPSRGSSVAGSSVAGSLSPSRAGDFLSCPLLFRYRTIDRLPERTTPDAVRGTLVHQVLEDLFDRPAAQRTPEVAHALVGPAWVALQERSSEARQVATDLAAAAGGSSDQGATDEVTDVVIGEVTDEATAAWLASAHASLDRWFTLEDPTRLEPAERELFVSAELDGGEAGRLVVRGIIDRLDQAPDGALRVVDYKTGSSPPAGYETRALFQLRIYGLVLWRSRGVVPRLLRLVYLGDSTVVSYEPDEAALRATERKVLAVWSAVREATEAGDFQPSPGKVCDWCSFHAHCPAQGGQLLPFPRTSRTSSPAQPAGLWSRVRHGLRALGQRFRAGA